MMIKKLKDLFLLSNETVKTTNLRIYPNYKVSGLWSVISQLQTEEVDSIKKVAESLLSAQNNDATASTSRNTVRDGRRVELKSIVSQYDNVNIDIYMNNLIGYHNYDIME